MAKHILVWKGKHIMHNPHLYDQPDSQSDYMDPSDNPISEPQPDESSTDYIVSFPKVRYKPFTGDISPKIDLEYEKLKKKGNRRMLALFMFALIAIVSWAIFSLKAATVTITALLIAIFVAASVAGFLIIFKK